MYWSLRAVCDLIWSKPDHLGRLSRVFVSTEPRKASFFNLPICRHNDLSTLKGDSNVKKKKDLYIFVCIYYSVQYDLESRVGLLCVHTGCE